MSSNIYYIPLLNKLISEIVLTTQKIWIFAKSHNSKTAKKCHSFKHLQKKKNQSNLLTINTFSNFFNLRNIITEIEPEMGGEEYV